MTGPSREELSDDALTWLATLLATADPGEKDTTWHLEAAAWVDGEQTRRIEDDQITGVQDTVEASGRPRPTRAVARVILRHNTGEPDREIAPGG